MDLVPLTADSPPDHVDGWARLFADLVEEEIPELEPPSRAEAVAELVSDEERTATGLLAVDGDRAVGALLAHLPQREDRDRADITLVVVSGARRRGIGRRLLTESAALLRTHGRGVVRSEVEIGTAGERFAAAVGGRETQRVVRSRLDLKALDDGRLAALTGREVAGYRIVSWTDRCPDELVAQFATARAAMNDAPLGEARRDPLAWDSDRVRRWEQRQRRRGCRAMTTAAVHEQSGTVAGFTEIFCTGARPRGVEQEDTAVVAAHRGHGLGLVLKAVNLQRLRVAEPDTRWIVTWNAADNSHMFAINTRLGYLPCAEEVELELELGRRPG